MVVASDLDAGYVTDRCSEIARHIKAVEAKRVSFTAPLLESKKRIDEEAKKITGPLQTIVVILKQKLLSWHQSQEEARAKDAALLQQKQIEELRARREEDMKKAMATGDQKLAEGVVEMEKNLERMEAKPVEVVRRVVTNKATSYVTTYWDYEIEDESKIPDEFWMLDTRKLSSLATTLREIAAVPGVKFVQKQRMGIK